MSSNSINFAFPKLTGFLLLTTNRLKTRSPNLTLVEHPCNTLSFNLILMQPSPDELLDDYLHHVSELLSIMYHTSDMSRISDECTQNYSVVYSLSCRKLKGGMAGHRSTQWKMMEECFRDIYNIGHGYKWAKAISELNKAYRMH